MEAKNQRPAAVPPTRPSPPAAADEGVLESIGKAISDPVKTGAEEEDLTKKDTTETEKGQR